MISTLMRTVSRSRPSPTPACYDCAHKTKEFFIEDGLFRCIRLSSSRPLTNFIVTFTHTDTHTLKHRHVYTHTPKRVLRNGDGERERGKEPENGEKPREVGRRETNRMLGSLCKPPRCSGPESNSSHQLAQKAQPLKRCSFRRKSRWETVIVPNKNFGSFWRPGKIWLRFRRSFSSNGGQKRSRRRPTNVRISSGNLYLPIPCTGEVLPPDFSLPKKLLPPFVRPRTSEARQSPQIHANRIPVIPRGQLNDNDNKVFVLFSYPTAHCESFLEDRGVEGGFRKIHRWIRLFESKSFRKDSSYFGRCGARKEV